DLLDVSRITRGKVELRRERVDVEAIVEQAVQATDALVRERGHTLEVVLPGEPVPLDADPSRLVQVFANLLQNAAKYTEPGGRIRCVARRDGEAIEVSVRDTGIGIRPENLFRIFE